MKIKSLKIINKFASTGIRDSYIVEKKSGMPQRWKTPSVKIKWVRV